MASVRADGLCGAAPSGQPLQWVGDVHDEDKTDVDICETQWDQGRVVKGIEVWASKWNVQGIQLTFSNDELGHMIGTKQGNKHQKLEWDPKSDTVEDVQLWSNPQATRLGKIYIKLSNGATLDIGIDKPAETAWYQETHSGIMLGAFGRADSAISAWGFMFLEDRVAKISISDFKFDEDLETFVSQRRGIDKVVFDSHVIYATTTNDPAIWVERTKTETNSYSYTQAVTWSYGLNYELEISAQVAGLGPKMSFGVEWKVGMEFRKQWTESEATTLTFKVNQPVEVGHTTMCVGYTEMGVFDGGYDALVHITLKNGKEFEFRERGTRKQAVFGKSETRCADLKGDFHEEDPTSFVERVQSNWNQTGQVERRIPTAFIG
ncbi:hypothetical protein K458DRAFT_402977 [Lentithecium fluviatile CBS 122367]|uniref:Jacalin-type lectin domain-containing protein n=1 Tax=Lentithecium fluviatile CBS 122367 TaxID=1168545 RepID=A0A6G1J505_9PLEO|nr:hypothetical protein K458DRAFT_402977 [Lentithecium fluviatile CBS 122367]